MAAMCARVHGRVCVLQSRRHESGLRWGFSRGERRFGVCRDHQFGVKSGGMLPIARLSVWRRVFGWCVLLFPRF
jgi:hypothetical protein